VSPEAWDTWKHSWERPQKTQRCVRKRNQSKEPEPLPEDWPYTLQNKLRVHRAQGALPFLFLWSPWHPQHRSAFTSAWGG
jgi:hypothetical protein